MFYIILVGVRRSTPHCCSTPCIAIHPIRPGRCENDTTTQPRVQVQRGGHPREVIIGVARYATLDRASPAAAAVCYLPTATATASKRLHAAR